MKTYSQFIKESKFNSDAPDFSYFDTKELKQLAHEAILKNDKLLVSQLTTEIKKRILEKGGKIPTKISEKSIRDYEKLTGKKVKR